MSETTLLAILGLVGALLTHLTVFFLGQRSERRKQSLLVRSKLLDPIESWLDGSEKISGILADTLTSIQAGSPLPMSYDFDQRKKAYQYMAESTNRIIGILDSKRLRTFGTKQMSDQLTETIKSIDNLVKFQMLPQEYEVVDLAQAGPLPRQFIIKVMSTKMKFDELIQQAHSLIAKIKTALT